MPKYRMKRHSVTQPSDPSYKFIPLTQGQNALVDAEDFDWLDQWNWYALWNPNTNSFYAYRAGNKPMHVQILKHRNRQVDHINHDTLDNRKKNLRRCTLSQNKVNSGPIWRNASGFKGVYKSGNGWTAQVRKGEVLHYAGYFKTPEDAARAYNKKAQEVHGEFAFLNPIQ